eukprot:TRINITY_DN30904_c0_g1_i1.p1 TRINITY_DN30904_c0_g1~~TRINITY_DN30904_c0_g1_i1.p1  ORF type:complete len:817 (+),score=150.61 TRINITY_DN30904_c0_g1_i1:59-2509(+)
MSSALVKATALRLLRDAGGSLPAEQLLQGLSKQLCGVERECIECELPGLLHRKALILEDGHYSPGPAAGRRTAPLSSHQDQVLAGKRTQPPEDIQIEPATAEERATDVLPEAAKLLSQEQKQVLAAVLEGHNVFFTGLPGTGKSFTLCAIIEVLRKRLGEDGLAVCASTGAAACHIGGGTIHSFLGCGLGKRPEDFNSMLRHSTRLKATKALVVDEISMVSGDFLEMASSGLGQARGRPHVAFGGLQVVLCGDFLQLPPVNAGMMRPGACRFAFQAPVWESLELHTFVLTENFRQAADEEFQATLRRIRVGSLTDTDRAMLLHPSVHEQHLQRCRSAALRTTLYCRNVDVEKENLARLAKLPGEEFVIRAEDVLQSNLVNRQSLERQLERCLAPSVLRLKIGARVMLLKNKRTPDQCQPGQGPLVNGSVGEVVDFETMADGQVQPLVQFDVGSREYVCREAFTGGREAGAWKRLQLPLRLAWAVSVHKSQGMTLEGGVVDLRGAFEEGQVYVALSRFRSARLIEVLGLPDQIKVSSFALEFHERLSASKQHVEAARGQATCTEKAAGCRKKEATCTARAACCRSKVQRRMLHHPQGHAQSQQQVQDDRNERRQQQAQQQQPQQHAAAQQPQQQVHYGIVHGNRQPQSPHAGLFDQSQQPPNSHLCLDQTKLQSKLRETHRPGHLQQQPPPQPQHAGIHEHQKQQGHFHQYPQDRLQQQHQEQNHFQQRPQQQNHLQLHHSQYPCQQQNRHQEQRQTFLDQSLPQPNLCQASQQSGPLTGSNVETGAASLGGNSAFATAASIWPPPARRCTSRALCS